MTVGKKTGGRQPGTPNKRTRAIAAAVEQTAAALGATIPKAFDGDAHAFLMAVYKDPAHPIDLRVDAAKAAVRYEKPALSSAAFTLHHLPADALDDDTLNRRIADLEAEIARGLAGEAEPEGSPRKPH